VRIAYDFPLGICRGASGATVVQVSAYATCTILRPTIDAAAAIDATTTNMWVFCIGMTYIHEYIKTIHEYHFWDSALVFVSIFLNYRIHRIYNERKQECRITGPTTRHYD
jgi:hypothetical protein